MNGRIRGCSAHERTMLAAGWECAAVRPGVLPAELAATPAGLDWSPAEVPGTVASSLRQSGAWSLDAPPRNFDAQDWWFRLQFDAAPACVGERLVLGFDGLATLADVWLNGSALLTSANMFLEHGCDVTEVLAVRNELVIRFAALETALAVRRRRPRWRTPMVSNQQLRWIRTTLLGRTPGWSPPAAAVGPWRPVWLERRRSIDLHALRIDAAVTSGAAARGTLAVSCDYTALGTTKLDSAQLVVERGDRRFQAELAVHASAGGVSGALDIVDVDLWWPHSHGEPALYQASMRLVVRDALDAAARTVEIDLGSVGFRELALDRQHGDFSLRVNGRPIFCRGACWTPLDCVGLQASYAGYRDQLVAVRDAGMNMLRLAGALVYETDQFFDLCDELGILVWHDFMFANMDYPADDATFRASVDLEVGQQLMRLQARPALAVLCGNSEAAQQAAMSGAGRECWSQPLFETVIAALSQSRCPGVPYCPSSAHGGAFPHQPSSGATSYYGVGAYLLPVSDARHAGLRFASECLAFANVPENETLDQLARGQPLRCHHPRWKERVPRDQGAGWDFDDVRDHYLTDQFGLLAMPLRYADHDRYLRLGRVVSGEVMAQCFQEWRRVGSGCRGALVWFLRDLWAGAGWGLIDSTGLPKAAYYCLKRALQPRTLFVAAEGTNGLSVHVTNERAEAWHGRIEMQLYRHSEPVGPSVARTLSVAGASTVEMPATDLFEGFVDLSYAFRFGPSAYDVLYARLVASDGDAALAECFHFVGGLARGLDGNLGLSADATALPGGAYDVRLRCMKFAQSVHIEMPGFVADDQYFHMAPKSSRTVRLLPRVPAAPAAPEATVHAVNSTSVVRIGFAA